MGLTLKELSEKCGILPQLISDYENSRKEPGIKNLIILCKALEIQTNYLLNEYNPYDSGKINTYGNALRSYMDAIKISKTMNLLLIKKIELSI